MRPVSRKPVGSGLNSPPPGDFVIPPVHSEARESEYGGSPYYLVSEPPAHRQNTTASAAPQTQWNPANDTSSYRKSWEDTLDQFDYQEPQQGPQDYSYAPSVVSRHSEATGEWGESSTSAIHEPPLPPEPISPLRIHKQEPDIAPETPQQPEVEDQAALGIGTGSDYIKRRRKAAGICSSKTMPTVLPIGIKSIPVSKQSAAPPAFVRKAMDIRYAHLPQRMLASEIDDEDPIPDSPVGRMSYDSNPNIRHDHNQSLATVHTQSSIRRSTSSESVVEDIGKVKLFVANPDD